MDLAPPAKLRVVSDRGCIHMCDDETALVMFLRWFSSVSCGGGSALFPSRAAASDWYHPKSTDGSLQNE